MSDFKTTDEVIKQLQAITDRLSDLNEYERTINEQYNRVIDLTNSLEKMIEERQTKITDLEIDISKKIENLSKSISSFDEKLRSQGAQIESFNSKILKMNDYAISFSNYINTLKQTAELIVKHSGEIKEIQNRTTSQKLDKIISLLEKQ